MTAARPPSTPSRTATPASPPSGGTARRSASGEAPAPDARRSPPRRVRRGLLACSLAACLALAGCAALPVPGEPGAATAPPAPSADTPASPPGLSAAGVGNATALAAAHRRASVAEGVAFVASTTTRGRGPPVVDGPPNRTRTVRVVAAAGGDRFRVQRRMLTDDGCRAIDRWANGSAVVTRESRADAPTVTDPSVGTGDADGSATDSDSRVGVTRGPSSAVEATTLAGDVEWALAHGNYTLVDVQPGTDGRRYVLVADEYVPGPDEAVEADRVGMSSRAIVDASGRVRSLQATVVRTEWSRLGTTRRVRSVSYRAVDVGVAPESVPRPRWLDAEAGGDASVAGAARDGGGNANTGPLDDRSATACGGEAA